MTIKLFFFDMDGTLFEQFQSTHLGEGKIDNTIWGQIAILLGEQGIKADQRRWNKWEAGEYRNQMAWAADVLKEHQKEGLRKEQFDALVTAARYNDGVPEVLAKLRAKGIITSLITGGFLEMASRAQQELGITHVYAAAHIHWNKEGTIGSWNTLPADNQGKVDFVELLRREYGFSKEECAFVGDGNNDVPIAKHVGTSFAYRARPELKEVATHSIEDFREILKYV